jgi:hypothetical protein
MQCLTRSDYDFAVSRLQEQGVLKPAACGDIPEEMMGRKVLKNNIAHPNSMAARVDKHGHYTLYGSTVLRSEQTGDVSKSILHDHMEDVFDLKNKWGPPKMKPNWRAYNETLQYLMDPSDTFRYSYLDRAIDDYCEPLMDVFDDTIVPLTDREILMGREGSKFIRRVDMSTSMCFPLFGRKDAYFDPILDTFGKILNYVWPQSVIDERNRLKACWQRGERAYPIVCSFLKNEVKDLSSDKVRVFQGANVCMTMNIRELFLPIACELQERNELSEMAIGVDRMSPGWQRLMDHVRKYDKEHVLAWDYSKYDARMNAQMVGAALRVLIKFAKKCNYTEENIRIMENMVSDIVHPLCDYNGVLMMFYGSHPSGNPLTVILNSIVNSLYLRIAFFHITGLDTSFREHVSLLTYGDDGIATVEDSIKKIFNFTALRNFLHEHRIKITLPDKSDTVREITWSEADFLKCTSVYVPEIGHELGALEEDSIFKRLYMNVDSKEASPHEVAANCVADSLADWFVYGEAVYESRREKLQEVCRRAKLDSAALRLSYQDRVDKWKERYLS